METREEQARRLRAMHISVPDIARQTGLSTFNVYEVTEGHDMAVKKMSRLHFVRGTGWPWDLMATDPDAQYQPTGDQALDTARAIIDLLRGTSRGNPIRDALDSLPQEERKQIVEMMVHLIQAPATDR